MGKLPSEAGHRNEDVSLVVAVGSAVVVVAKQEADVGDAQRKVIGSNRAVPGQTPG